MFRQEQEVQIGLPPDARKTRVREITPLLAEKLHHVVLGSLEQEEQTVTARELADLIVGDAGLKLELLEQCSDLGPEVHELGGLAFMQLWEAFEEVNTPFLERLATVMRQTAPASAQQTPEKQAQA